MYLGEVCLLTRDVPRLARFYRALLGVDGSSDDPVHQTIVACEPMLTILRDDSCRQAAGQTMCVAFTVADMNAAYAHVQEIGAQIAAPPQKRPWGAINMSLYDPDGNIIYLRQLP